MPRLSQLNRELELLKARGLLRIPEGRESVAGREGGQLILASSNDYLGLAARNVSRETFARGALGAGASRLVFGTTTEHLDLEKAVAEWLGSDAALLFTSGYAANVGMLQSLADDPEAVIISDRLNHASIIDGCRLSKARVRVVAHRDTEAVQRALKQAADASARWVVTESYFSMDGTSPDLSALRALCDQHDAYLVVDEAHALGVFGPQGAGLCRAGTVRPDVLVATFGKALGAQGAAVCASQDVCRWLYNRARSFAFSTAPSPSLCAMLTERVQWIRRAESERSKLHRLTSVLRQHLTTAAVSLPDGSYGPIVPVLLGSNDDALAAAAALRSRGFLVQAIRPPTVPEGTARLRVTVNATMDDEQVERLAQALLQVAQ